jgi:3-oxoacid CoA-transferase subunit A
MAGAAKITIAEVEGIVPAGSLDPNRNSYSGNTCSRIFKAKYEKKLNKEREKNFLIMAFR